MIQRYLPLLLERVQVPLWLKRKPFMTFKHTLWYRRPGVAFGTGVWTAPYYAPPPCDYYPYPPCYWGRTR